MRSGNSYSWILIVIPILLISDGLKSVGYLPDCLLTLSPISVFRSMCACCTCSAFYDDDDLSPRCRRITCYLSCGFTSLIQLLFALVVGILYFKSDVFLGGESPGFGYFFLSLFLSMVLRAGSITIIYCYKNKFTLISQEDPTEMPGDPPKDPTKTTVKLQEDPTTPGEPQDNPTKTHDDLQEDPTETPGDPQK
ncbi:uncharacterized protein ACNLHF_016845 isoform 2-T2 [Anomaloglossus baeobatrachus]|uniref:uncharacterized protein LOC142272118 isoform X2 n=1 Tax=Anomaloglossus baeobatrachus TaxID=238106 RepID=UPI003F507A22